MKALFICILITLSASAADLAPPQVKEAAKPQSLSTREYLEMGAFVAIMATAVCSGIALWLIFLARKQLAIASDALVVAKDDIKIRSQREAVSLAAERCEDFGGEKMELIGKLRDEIIQSGIPWSRWKLLNKTFDETSLEAGSNWKQWVLGMQANGNGQRACKILNHLEAFAVYFSTGAADEQVAFPVLGPLFCDYVLYLAPWLITMRNFKSSGYTSGKYANTVKLFEIWADRIRAEEIEAEKAKQSKELDTLKIGTITPIGVTGKK